MVILGSLFLGADFSYECTPVSVPDINYLELDKGEYDGIYATSNTDLAETYDLSTTWDVNTIFAGEYVDSLVLSNVDFSLSTISHILIKKRKANSFKWTTILAKKIDTIEDLDIVGIDTFNAGNTKYQYALVPMLNNIEGSYTIAEAYSDFNGLYLLEKDAIYGTILDIRCDTQRNHSVILNNSLYKKYPRAIYNSKLNYDSGTVEAYFCKFDVNSCKWYPEDSIDYRKEFVDFLTDGKPKILKHFDGRIWLININIDSITDTEDGHYLHRKTSFGFFESGDYRNEKDLYDADLIDIDSEYWSYDT